MNWKLGYFPFCAVDYRAAQAWLDRQGAMGWRLKGIHLGCIARFERSGQERVRHCVDLHREVDGIWDGDEYLRLCADSGWDYVTWVRGMAVFAARPVCDPAPLQTDRGLEEETFWRRVIRRDLLDTLLGVVMLALLGVLWAVAWGGEGGLRARPSYELLCSTGALLLAASLAVLAVSLIWDPVYHLRRWRQRRRGGQTAGPKTFWPRLYGTWSLLPKALMTAYLVFYLLELGIGAFGGYSGREVADRRPELRERPVVMAEELGEDPAAVCYLSWEPVWSLPVRGARYLELLRDEDGYRYIWCDRYTCVTEGYASLLAGSIRRDCGERSRMAYGVLHFQPADLGVDEGWATEDGAFLLLRQGRTVALVGTNCMDGPEPDLRKPEYLTSITEKLELG